jgi:hypothetical protein
VQSRASREGSDSLAATAAAGLCAVELADGRPEAAVAAGWRALGLGTTGEDRARALLAMGAAFRSLGLPEAAEACYQIVLRSEARPDSEGEARLAVEAARQGGLEDPLEEADLLASLEDRAVTALREAPSAPSEDARSIAREIESMGRQLVAAG